MGIFVLDIHPTYPTWMFFDFVYSRKNGTKEKKVRVEHKRTSEIQRFFLITLDQKKTSFAFSLISLDAMNGSLVV